MATVAGGIKAKSRVGGIPLGISAPGCPRLESTSNTHPLHPPTPPRVWFLEGEGGCADAQASSPALVTVPGMGYAPAPTPTSLQPLLPQQPVFAVQEVSAGTWRWAGAGCPGLSLTTWGF